MSKDHFDVAVVGAGVVGLAHAYQLAKRGLRVAVFERGPKSLGASVRNFGMIWPIGQPAGALYSLACRSAAVWREVMEAAGLWYAPVGSLHLAYQDDEAQVLAEFVETAGAHGFGGVELLGPAETARRSSAVKTNGLKAALWSDTEINVDPRQTIASLPAYLTAAFGVRFFWNTTVTGYTRPEVLGGSTVLCQADRLYVCAGADLQTLYPEALGASGIIPCKLQMLRAASPAPGWELGAMLAAGLTLQHYRSFAHCKSLPALKERFADEMPEYNEWGIHVLVSQNSEGALTLGDSHEYGDTAWGPFNQERIDELILRYLDTFLRLPSPRQIVSRWNGVYPKHPQEPYIVLRPAEGVTAITGLGGAGMTLSFGLAEKIVEEEVRS